ncbi:MAG TPA: family 16 glycosylhydrolase [Polyangiaceae bacterium]|nr:family 16 glycosylhydrolase [Polyangiaceae bacterium]
MNHRVIGCVLALATLCLAPAAGAVASAELYQTAALRYGRFEARILMPAGDGIVGSFFLWKDGSEQAGTFWNELDFEKINADCTMHLNSIYGNPHQNHGSVATVSGTACVGYHSYGFEWTPSYIAWSVDGAEVRRDTGTDAQVYVDNAQQGMKFDFNIWPGTPDFGGNFSASSLPVHEFISWIQYSAYTPGAGDGGGDFTQKWRESFESGSIPAGWAVGNWTSPSGLSTHSPANVTVTGGFAVLSLTADDATGFTGTPPVDSGDLPSAMGASGAAAGGASASAGAGGASANGAAGGDSGGAANAGVSGSMANAAGSGAAGGAGMSGASGSGSNPSSNSSGCSCSTRPRREGPMGLWLAAIALGFALRRRAAARC